MFSYLDAGGIDATHDDAVSWWGSAVVVVVDRSDCCECLRKSPVSLRGCSSRCSDRCAEHVEGLLVLLLQWSLMAVYLNRLTSLIDRRSGWSRWWLGFWV